MGWGDPSIRLNGSQYECVCNIRKPGKRKEICGEKLRGDNERDVKKMWRNHKDWHKTATKKKVDELRGKYKQRVAELLEEYESIDNIPKSKFSGLHTKGIPNVPDGQNVNGKVYDKNGKPVPYEVLKMYVQGWDD